MKIVHISDIHIRNLKFHEDYRKVFADFYRHLDRIRPDLVVNTGDTAHTKTNISPEFVDMTKDLFTEIAKRCPLIIVLGNHDLNLMNEDRQDAITPIVDALDNPNIKLLKKSGPYEIPGRDFVFWNFGISDVENWPRPPYDTEKTNIGLFHGSIRNCVTDSNFRMTQVEYDQDIFDGLDFVMMGDIHKRQGFKYGRIWYAGSMIQQNFGEDPDKGFLLWDIANRHQFGLSFHELKGNRRFYTVKINDDLTLPADVQIDPDNRIRLLPPRQITLVEQKAIEKLARKKYNPHDIITLGAQNISQTTAVVDQDTETIENIRKLDVQERLLRSFFKNQKIDEKVMTRILDLNRKYQIAIEQKDDVARGVKWRVLKMGWNNLYNYGEGNVIDFSQIKGLTGIFAPNASGKSGMIDVITVGAYDCNTKEVMKNVHLINDNKDQAAIILELMANGERYTITRGLERVKYGQRKGSEKEWGKTSLSFIRHESNGGTELLNGELRPQTEAAIRKRFGGFDEFMLTSLFAQWDPMDLIMVKETERKRILFRFLDLDIFEEKAKLAKDEAKAWKKKLEELEESDLESIAKDLRFKISVTRDAIDRDEKCISNQEMLVAAAQNEIEKLLEKKASIPQIEWKLDEERAHLKLSEQNIEMFLRKIAEHEAVIDRNRDDLKGQQEMMERSRKLFNAESRERFAKIEEEKRVKSEKIKDLERKIGAFSRQASLLEKVPCGDQFPSCQFLLDAFQAKKSLPIAEKELQDCIDDMKNVEKRWWELKQEDHAAFTYEAHSKIAKDILFTIKQNETQIEKLQAKVDTETALKWRAKERIEAIEKAAADVLENSNLDSQISLARENRRQIESNIRIKREEMGHNTKQLGLDEGRLQALDKELAQIQEVREVCNAFEKFGEAMGKDGIALQILTQKLPLINQEINKILAQASDFSVHIEYDKDEQSIRLTLQYAQYKSRLLELGSGAEKFLASVAIRAALLSISNLPRSNLFIVDEGFGKLDPSNLEAVGRMFDYLKSVFDHVIVISHLDVMKDMVDNIIEITQDDEGYAHVEVGG